MRVLVYPLSVAAVLTAMVVIGWLTINYDCQSHHANRIMQQTNRGRIKAVNVQFFVDSTGRRHDILVLRDSMTGVEYLVVVGGSTTEIRMVQVEQP